MRAGIIVPRKNPTRPTTSVAIFEHIANPDHPSQLHENPHCNYVMPAYPGAREVPLPEGKTLLLRHRLWIHRDAANDTAELTAELRSDLDFQLTSSGIKTAARLSEAVSFL